jgi:hypothetical protein
MIKTVTRREAIALTGAAALLGRNTSRAEQAGASGARAVKKGGTPRAWA